jgi:hypothetical protein
VVADQHFLNFTEGLSALHARLPLPEHDESLTAHTALGFGVSACAFAQNLHLKYLDLAWLPPANNATIGDWSYR